MPLTDPAFWSDHLRRTLARYDEPLVRQVAARLLRPRNHWPVEDLIERMTAAMTNAAVVDRRLKDLDAASRRLLALLSHSRQPRCRLGNLVELLVALGHADGLAPVRETFAAGLLYPDLPTEGLSPLKGFDHWLGHASAHGLPVFAHPAVAARALGEDLDLPECPVADVSGGAVHEADGLEVPLR